MMKMENEEKRESRSGRSKGSGIWTLRNVIIIIICSVLFYTYAMLYCVRFFQLNFGGTSKRVLAREWEPKFWEMILGFTPEEDYEAVVLWLDLNGDGKEEIITNGGPFLMGGSQYFYYVFEPQPNGEYKGLGGWFVDEFEFIMPPLTIWGWPGIWLPDRVYKWVPWKDGMYRPKDPWG